ncbi:MAG: hypothetical protein JNK02_17855 [Planctomycetes bacterium]|nr:hypothetical protein [Planctomycetota bacterium]
MVSLAVLFLLSTALGEEGSPGDLFSLVLVSAGDLDRDGIADILVSDPVDADRSVCAGRVWAVSGKDSSVLKTWRGEAGEMLGSTLGSTGDLDGYEVPDVFLGAGNRRVLAADGTWRQGEMAVWRVVSGRTGSELLRLEGVAHDARVTAGPSFAALRDVDGDGVPDFAVGSARGMRDTPLGNSTVRRSSGSRVALHSGKTGGILWLLESSSDDAIVGEQLVAADDLDGDGVADLLASVKEPGTPAVCARILSGKDGRRIRSIDWVGDRGFHGPLLAAGADLDGDQVADVIVALGSGLRRAVCYSGRNGNVLREWRIVEDSMYPTAPFYVPDVDADGIVDVVLTLPHSFSGPSRFMIVSGGREDARLLEVGFAPWESTHFACSILSVPDRDGDGIADLLVGEASQRHHGWQGEARYYSTRSGRLLGSITRATLERDTRK